MKNFLAITGMAVVLASNQVAAQSVPTSSIDTIMQRLDAVEKKNARLEGENAALRDRVRRLEGIKAKPTASPSPSYARATTSDTNDDRLSRSQSIHEVNIRPWAGFYTGINGGGGWASDHFDHIYSPLGILASHPLEIGLGGFIGMLGQGGSFGGQFGYNWQPYNNWVVGAEVDFSASTIRKSETHSSSTTSNQCAPLPCTDFITTTYTEQMTNKVRDLGSVRARIGFIPEDNILIYATSGLAWGSMTHSATSSIAIGPCVGAQCGAFVPSRLDGSFSQTTNHFGWVMGAGVEWKTTRNIILGLLYLHYDLGKTDIPTAINSQIPTDLATVFPAASETADVVSMRLSWLFSQ